MSTILPTSYEDFINRQLPNKVSDALLEGFQSEAKTSIRIHPSRPIALPYPTTDIPWCPLGKLLENRPVFTLDPLWHSGAYYVQEAGSMAVAEAVKHLLPKGSKLVLDLCAAPGGKSTHLRDVLPNESLLVSNEIIKTRVARLEDNLERWGHPGYAITNLDPAIIGKRASNLFDVIVVDAPCSGEGLFRKDSHAAAEWSEAHVDFCAARQQRILEDIWPALRPGGLLIYSTCTMNVLENESTVRFVVEELAANTLPLPETITSHAVTSDTFPNAVRLLPNNMGTEGQFIVAIKKLGTFTAFGEEADVIFTRKEAERLPKVPAFVATHLKDYLPLVNTEDFFMHKEVVRWLPESLRIAALRVLQSLPILSLGIAVVELVGKHVQPLQGLAHITNTDLITSRLELDLPQALSYLKKEDQRGLLDAVPGLHLATYRGMSLGWLKSIQGGRINNLLPMAKRIRMDIPMM